MNSTQNEHRGGTAGSAPPGIFKSSIEQDLQYKIDRSRWIQMRSIEGSISQTQIDQPLNIFHM